MTVTFCRHAAGDSLTPGDAALLRTAGVTTVEASAPDAAWAPAVIEGGLLPVAATVAADGAVAWVLDPADALAVAAAGTAGWRLTVRHTGSRAEVIDALARSRAPWLRTDRDRVAEAVSITGLPAMHATVSVPVDDIDQAVAAVRGGAGDLLIGDWDDEAIGALREALAPGRLVERVALPVFCEIDAVRQVLDKPAFTAWCNQVDGAGAARPRYAWAPGRDMPAPVPGRRLSAEWADRAWVEGAPEFALDRLHPALAGILERSLEGAPPTRDEVEVLFAARGAEVEAIAHVADVLRDRTCGDTVTYVVNRNINYTNQCYFKCGFCGFSRGPKSLQFKDDPYILEIHEVVHRSVEAWERGATEVCLVGGIHPKFTGDFYAAVLEAIKARLPQMHVHGFTPLEVWQGAATLGVSVEQFLVRMRDSGLGTLPGTAAEILDDEIRRFLCPDKLTTAEWAEVMITAHRLGLRATSTIMHGHIDHPRSWANHYEVLREVQRRTGGFTEFVPLPFVHMGAPIYLQGRSRPGPTWDEVVLIHAVARIAFDGLIPNIQASWVKLGLEGGARLLEAGCNDIGGTLMNESISRAAGAAHGQLATPDELEAAIRGMGRVPARRNTVYERIEAPA
ncbi:MAG: 5-amino-6-(D-ribitylamino)uracil--L-tyrosine 4-hydroxyphenyl transferase CofH [Thermoleophilia bacterium]|nr:5-amino-6-(D-ribitylamino)uracil--L-tyrosine 4-hydroxyphenyl transferase CofH [Thermoleophilia bacterium]